MVAVRKEERDEVFHLTNIPAVLPDIYMHTAAITSRIAEHHEQLVGSFSFPRKLSQVYVGTDKR